MMEDRTEPSRNAPVRRRFVLTPRPDTSGPEELCAQGRLRRTLVIGGAVVPVALTIRGRSALAQSAACPTLSVPLSATNSAAAGTYATKCAYTPAVWTTYFPQLQAKAVNLATFRFPQQLSYNTYLADPSVSGIFTLPVGTSSVALSFQPSGTITQALSGGVKLTVTFGTGSATQSYTDTSGAVAEAIAAVLNAAYFGPKYNGTTDDAEIGFINGLFSTLQGNAGSYFTGNTIDTTGLNTYITSNITTPLSNFNAA